jgi:hypothetical protein
MSQNESHSDVLTKEEIESKIDADTYLWGNKLDECDMTGKGVNEVATVEFESEDGDDKLTVVVTLNDVVFERAEEVAEEENEDVGVVVGSLIQELAQQIRQKAVESL